LKGPASENAAFERITVFPHFGFTTWIDLHVDVFFSSSVELVRGAVEHSRKSLG
jgi:hypothetical protein